VWNLVLGISEVAKVVEKGTGIRDGLETYQWWFVGVIGCNKTPPNSDFEWYSALLYCITPALDRYVSHLDRTPCTWTMMSLNICSTVLYDIQHPHSHLSLMLPSNHLLLSDLLPSELTTHGPHHWLNSTSLAIIHVSQDLGLICGPYCCREKMWNEVESETNEILKGVKVPLRDNRSATFRNCT